MLCCYIIPLQICWTICFCCSYQENPHARLNLSSLLCTPTERVRTRESLWACWLISFPIPEYYLQGGSSVLPSKHTFLEFIILLLPWASVSWIWDYGYMKTQVAGPNSPHFSISQFGAGAGITASLTGCWCYWSGPHLRNDCPRQQLHDLLLFMTFSLS